MEGEAGHSFSENSEHGSLPLSGELGAMALLPGPRGEHTGPCGPSAPTPGPRGQAAGVGPYLPSGPSPDGL